MADQNVIIQKGMGAFLMDFPIDRNPYESDTRESFFWDKGWKRQEFLFKMQAPDVVYHNPWFQVCRTGGCHWVEASTPGGAAVLPVRRINGRLEMLLVAHFRHLCGSVSWEIPRGGRSQSDRDSSDTALREFSEETGYSAGLDNLRYLGHIYPDNGILRSSIPLYSVTIDDNERGSTDGETDSQIWVDISEAVRMVSEGQIFDGFTLSALLFWFSTNGEWNLS